MSSQKLPVRAGLDGARFRLAWQAMDEVDSISIETYRNRSYSVAIKEDGSPVTDLDRRIDDLLATRIGGSFGADGIISEEGGVKVSENSEAWIVDPLDGTSNFIEQIPIYAHMIAFAREGLTVFSVVSAPLLARRWWAYRGHGAYCGTAKISVSGTSHVESARFAYGGLRDYSPEDRSGLVRLIESCARSRGFGNFFPHMLVAEGTYDIASSGTGSEIWDRAPIAFIIEEAGGKFTSLDGHVAHAHDSILSSNSVLHDQAIAQIRHRPVA